MSGSEGPLCSLGPQRLAVASHQPHDFVGRLSKMQQGSIHFFLQLDKLREVFQMRGFLFDSLRQIFDRIEVWREAGSCSMVKRAACVAKNCCMALLV